MNFSNPKDRATIERILRAGTVEVPHSSLPTPCVIPKTSIPHGTISKDYTFIRMNNVPHGAHVVALGLRLGRLPLPGKLACHLCDNPPCRNPDHLVEGTPGENMRQAKERGRTARGAAHGSKTHPESISRGEKNRMCKMTAPIAAAIKWCLQNQAAWFTPEVRAVYPLCTALAITFDVTEPSVKQIRAGNNWREVVPAKPEKLPFSNGIVIGQSPKQAQRQGSLTPDQVRAIRVAYHQTEKHRSFVRRMADNYKVSQPTIRSVLQRRTYNDVAPEIPAVHELGHGMADLTEREVQQIRATFAKWGGSKALKGLLAALGRKFNCRSSHVRNIVEHLLWIHVPDDPEAWLPLEELEFKELTQRGANHPLSKLGSDAAAYDALRRMHAGERKETLAKEYGVTGQVMYRLFKGKTWRHVWEKFHADNPHLQKPPQDDANSGGTSDL